MATQKRQDASTISKVTLPRLPAAQPKDWSEKASFGWAKNMIRAIEDSWDIIHRVQDNGTDQPLRAKLNFIGASVTDDLASDTVSVSIGGGAGAAPVNASYICVSLNATLTNERAMVISTGLSVTDAGANSTYTVGLDTSNTRNIDHAVVNVTAGAGLTGGGTIEVTRTIDVGAGDGITVNANDVAVTPTYARTFLLMGA